MMEISWNIYRWVRLASLRPWQFPLGELESLLQMGGFLGPNLVEIIVVESNRFGNSWQLQFPRPYTVLFQRVVGSTSDMAEAADLRREDSDHSELLMFCSHNIT
jgi:hypothetical protein